MIMKCTRYQFIVFNESVFLPSEEYHRDIQQLFFEIIIIIIYFIHTQRCT